jgi:hypothetical protein
MKSDFPSPVIQAVVEPNSGGPTDGRFRKFDRKTSTPDLMKTCFSIRLRPDFAGNILIEDSSVLDPGLMLTFLVRFVWFFDKSGLAY